MKKKSLYLLIIVIAAILLLMLGTTKIAAIEYPMLDDWASTWHDAYYTPTGEFIPGYNVSQNWGYSIFVDNGVQKCKIEAYEGNSKEIIVPIKIKNRKI